MKLKNLDKNDFTQVEQYADAQVAEMIAACTKGGELDTVMLMDLLKDHIIHNINPDFFPA